MAHINRFEIVRISVAFQRAADRVELTADQLEGLDMDQFRVQAAQTESSWGDGARHDGLETILENTVFSTPIEHPLYEDAPFDGIDYTGCEAGMAWDGTESCAWHTSYSSVAQCPELLVIGSDVEDGGEDATWSAKRGGYDRPDMMGIDWAWLATESSSRPARVYVARPRGPKPTKSGVGKAGHAEIPSYTDRGRVQGRKNAGRRQSSYVSTFGEGYSTEAPEPQKLTRNRIESQSGSFIDLWPAIRNKRLAGIDARRKGLPKTQTAPLVFQPKQDFAQALAAHEEFLASQRKEWVRAKKALKAGVPGQWGMRLASIADAVGEANMDFHAKWPNHKFG